MGRGGGRGGRKILDWPEGVFPRRAIGSSDCVFPLVRPIGCIVSHNGILGDNDIPLKVTIEEGLARRGVPP